MRAGREDSGRGRGARLRVIQGGGQIALEEALLREVGRLKGADPWARLAIVVPSESVRLHLLEVLPRRAGRGLLGLHILTLPAFAWEILRGSGATMPAVEDSLLVEEEAIRMHLTAGERTLAPLASLADFARGPTAVASTLRDLRDAGVEARALRRAAPGPVLGALARLAEGLAERFTFYADAARAATQAAGRSAFLGSLAGVYYYGLYDLVGVQRNLLRSVAAAAPLTLFLPLLRDGPAFEFARRSLDRIAEGLEVEELPAGAERGAVPGLERLFARDAGAEGGPPPRESVEVASAGSLEDEVAVAAKEVLRLRAGGIPAHAISVVSRNLAAHLPVIREVFPEHRIPFASAEGPAFGSHPLAKAAVALARLVGSELPRRAFLDLVASPAFLAADGAPALPALWDRITRALGIAGGADWERLSRDVRPGRARLEEDEEGGGVEPGVWAREARRLQETVAVLRRELALDGELGTFAGHVETFRARLGRRLGSGGAPADQPREALEGILGEIARVPGEGVEYSRFADLLDRAVRRAALPGPPFTGRGVRVLAPEAARGRTCEALLLLGVNELVWPRRASEDPLLPDVERERLSRVLERPLPLKGESAEEERLLFPLLLSSARSRAFLVWRRRDDRGRPANPSWFLEELERATGRLARTEVPGPLASRFSAGGLWSAELLTPAEAAVAARWAGGDPVSALRAAARVRPERKAVPGLLERGLRFLETIEDFDADGACDGETGPLEPFWGAVLEKGVSPTALQRYARCPFQYLAHAVLRLEPLEEPEGFETLGPLEAGEVCHDVLRRFYEGVATGREALGALREGLEGRLDRAAREAFARFEVERPVGYPLAWEHWRMEIRRLLGVALREDLDALLEEGLAPRFLEEAASAPLPIPGDPVRAFGILDRIDVGEGGRFRVVDYKFTLSASPRHLTGRFDRPALRGARLQPPVYLLLARARLGEGARGGSTFFVLAPRAPKVFERLEGLEGEFWESAAGAECGRTLRAILDGMKGGRFPITPGEEADGPCRTCDFAEVCRKGHYPSRWRASRSPAARAMAALASKDLPGRGEEGEE
ncbi:MAG TPA: PD-(D/E)XK nuclease family protein [Planctomycetota bacterium]|nr:PD-(D/E)XK nuclease family protein [Planctomycetota bacterium]